MPNWTQQEYEQFKLRHVANRPHNSGTPPVLERSFETQPVATDRHEEAHPARFHVCVTSIRKRLLDEDNLCAKFHVDCLRRAGLIPNDNPATAHIEVMQRRCYKGEMEYTVILVRQLS